MARKGGNPLCVGNENSGRKTIAEELKGAVEKITNEALIELAKSKVKKQLDQDLDFTQTKEMALPITLKGISDKEEHTIEFGKPILDALLNHNSDKKDNKAEQTDQDNPGRDGSEQDGINNPLLDSLGPERQDPDPDEHSERELPPLEKGRDTRLPDDNERA
jgi:hypothetical protein